MVSEELITLVAELGKRLEEQAQQIQMQAQRIAELEAANKRLKQLIGVGGSEERVESAEVYRELQRR